MNVLCFEPFGSFNHFELDHFAFLQGFETLAENGGVMNEDILAAILNDEAKTLLVIEPFYFAASHRMLPKEAILIGAACTQTFGSRHRASKNGFLIKSRKIPYVKD